MFTKTTSHKVVLPFYGYAAISFMAATLLLLFRTPVFTTHYFHPHTLAITHIMALGWGTMIILGASHQLVPVLIEGKLYSERLAYWSFMFAAVGIPLLVYGFYVFDMGWPAKFGGSFVIASVVIYLVNLGKSMSQSKNENPHAIFVFTAGVWLLVTCSVGLLLVFNFTTPLFSKSSLDYLALHAHLGIVGWFLLLVTGVATRLIPMFFVSKYSDARQLWWMYAFINGGLLGFILIFLYAGNNLYLYIPAISIAFGIFLFGNYCYKAYRQRIRKSLDEQMKLSVLSVGMMALPVVMLVAIIVVLLFTSGQITTLALTYGFVIFFGWLTAIILGMTFKTLPFIVWNKVYHQLAGKGKTPNPKDLVNDTVFKYMCVVYLAGFILFTTGILVHSPVVLQSAAALLVLAAILYNWNVLKVLTHKPVMP